MIDALAPNRVDLWRIRLYYFVWTGGGGVLYPFISLFYVQNGLSGTEIGLLATVSSVIALLAAPLWGRWSDNVPRPRRLLQGSLLGSALCMLWLSAQTRFFWMAAIIGLAALVSAAVEPLSDTLALAITHGDEKSGFGSVRLWGSLGWAIAAPASGWIIERASLKSAFWGYAILTGVSIAILSLMRTESSRGRQSAPDSRPAMQVIVGELLRDRAMIGLGIALAIMWLSNAGRHQFESIYLNQLGAAESVIGLVNTVGALVELPAMLWADRLLRRRGSDWVLRAALILEIVGMACVLAVPSVPVIFIMRLFAGVGFSLYTVATLAFITERAPGQQSATALALYTVTLHGIVSITSGPLSGLAFDTFGAYWLYAIALGGNALAWLTLRLAVTGRRSRIQSSP